MAGAGLGAYAHARFRIEVVGAGRLALPPGTVLAVAHRSEEDVPVVVTGLHLVAGLGRRRPPLHMSFAAREDLFAPGFLAGFPPRLPVAARRLLFGVSLARGLRAVNVHPLASAGRMRLGEALALAPAGVPLADLLPAVARADLARAAAAAGLPPPRDAAGALRGALAFALWRDYGPAELAHPALAPAWRARRARALADLRQLLAVVRDGAPLVIFPEGRPSPDGTLGPVRRGLGALLRRGEARAVQPVGVAYDPLVRGRTRAVLGVGGPVAPGGPEAEVEARVLAALARALPLTCGAAVADAVLAAAGEGGRPPSRTDLACAVDTAVRRADATGRCVEGALRRLPARARRLDEAIAALGRAPAGDPRLARLALEHRGGSELLAGAGRG